MTVSFPTLCTAYISLNILSGSLQCINSQLMLCTHGFPAFLNRQDVSSRNSDIEVTRIIPGMKITCCGALTRWTATGTSQRRASFPKLKIFRESGGLYNFVAEVELGTCGGVAVERSSQGLYECELSQKGRIPVKQNDIIGIYLPPLSQSGFNIYFTTYTTDQVNYVYLEDVTSSVSLSSGAMTKNTPQISLRVDTSVMVSDNPPTTQATATPASPLTPGDVVPLFGNTSTVTVGGLSQSFIVSSETVLFIPSSATAGPQVSTSELVIPAFTASTTEGLTTPYQEVPTKLNVIVITFATILFVIALFLLSAGGCLLFKVRCRYHKIIGTNNMVQEKVEDTEVTIGSSDICEVDYAKICDEECESLQQNMNEVDHRYHEQNDDLSLNAVQIPETNTLVQSNESKVADNSSECSTSEHLGELNEGHGDRDGSVAGVMDSVEMHQLVNDLEESYEPAYLNVEGHFIALNQAL